MSKSIIGFTGSFGSGCTKSAEHLKDIGHNYISISTNILTPLAKKYDKPFKTRKEKQLFGNYVRENHKKEYKDAFLSIVEKNQSDVVIECFRNPVEIDFLREEYPHFYLIALFAPKALRKQRTKEPDFNELDKIDEGEEKKLGQQVRRCVNNADIVINNSLQWDTLENAKNFFDKLNSYINLLKVPDRPPSAKEMIMHLAYSVSLRSQCIQRQVGAVITDEHFRVLSTGYNDVPYESDSCFELYSHCYRKIRQEKALLKSTDHLNFCIKCGKQLKVQKELFEKKGVVENFVKCNNCGMVLDEILSSGKEMDYCRSLHAEENAILSNPYLSEHISKGEKQSIMFTTTFPCMLCAKKIANAGIRQLIFVEPYPISESRKILEENNVTINAFEGIKSLKFNWIFRKRGKHLKDMAVKQRQQLNQLTKRG